MAARPSCLGLAVAVTEPTIVPTSYSAGIALSATVLGMGVLGYQILEPDTIARARPAACGVVPT